MQGEDVRLVQRELGIAADGVLGPQTAAHIRAWKWRPGGFRRRDVDEALRPVEQRWLLGVSPAGIARIDSLEDESPAETEQEAA